MKPSRVPEDLIQAGFDAIRAWYAAHPSPNAYLDDRTQMRIVLAAVLTAHNERVEQPLRERAEAAERELAELDDEWNYETRTRTGWYRGSSEMTDSTMMTEEYARNQASGSDRMRVVHRKAGKWKPAEQQPEADAGDPS